MRVLFADDVRFYVAAAHDSGENAVSMAARGRQMTLCLKDVLDRGGFETKVEENAGKALNAAEEGLYDLLIIGDMMTGTADCGLVKNLRDAGCGIPVLMYTANRKPAARVECLNAGADACMSLPFSTDEFTATVNALLRRYGREKEETAFGDIALRAGPGILTCGEKSVRLTCREKEILLCLIHAGDSGMTKQTILKRVCGEDTDVTENNIEVFVVLLRRKLAEVGSAVRIVAARKYGYHLETGEE